MVRKLDLNIIDNAFLKGYDGVVYSFKKNNIKRIISGKKLDKILHRAFLEMYFMNELEPNRMKVKDWRSYIEIINAHQRNAHLSDIYVDYFKIANICKVNNLKKVLFIIDEPFIYPHLKLFDYLSELYKIDVDLTSTE